MSMAWMKMPGQTWAAASSEFFKLWIVMMVAMMLPSLVPMLLHYRRAIRAQTDISAGPLTTATAVGYFFVWAVIGAVIYPVGVFLSTAEMRSPTLQRFVPAAIGLVLLLAGALQLTPWKLRRLTRCRNAMLCDQGRSSTLTAWRHGLHLGVDCSLCCIGFMIALTVTDLMSLTYMAAAALAITAERFALKPQRMARMVGTVMVVAGGLAVVFAAK